MTLQISKFFATLGIEVSQGSVKKVDATLDHVENRLKRLGKFGNKPIVLDIGGFNLDQNKLKIALGNSLDVASKQVAFEISRFVVNDRNLLAALLRAARRLPPVPPGPHPPPVPPLPPGPGPYPPGGRRRSTSSVNLSRLYGPALALGFGGYGLSQLNQRNQQVVSAQLQSQAVVQQAGGTEQQGKDSFQYLKNEGQRIGFNYLDASQDYNKLISGLTGSGVGLKESQKVFSGFAELARVNKLDKTTQNRLFRALSQVAGKGKLQSEELTGQIAEALPGGTALFAEAYQKQIGGNKTGAEAIQQLLANMKKGKVTSDILTYAGAAASERANKGGALGTASQASQAEQARYQNSVNDLAVVASNAGVEEGFARIFRTLSAGLDESNGLVRLLAEGFNDVTKFADDLLLFPQSFIRALDGRDSLVADWLGKDATVQLQKDWNSIKDSITTISSLGAPSWLPSLQTVSKDIAAQFQIIAALSNGDLSGVGEGLKNFVAGRAKSYGNAIVSGPNLALRAAGELFDTPTPQLSTDGLSFYAPKSTLSTFGLTKQLSSVDPLTGEPLPKYDIFSDSPLGPQYDSNVFGQKLAGLGSLTPEERYNARNSTKSLGDFPFNLPALETTPSGGPFQDLSQPPAQTPADIASQNRDAALAQSAQTVTNTTTNQFDITISVDATLAGVEIEQQARAMADALSAQITGAFEQVQVNYPTTR